MLRAAFAALRGTFADPAINFFLNSKTPGGNPRFTLARLGGTFPADAVAVVGADGGTPDPDDCNIIFSRRFQFEKPFLLTNVWAHEPLHCGPGLDRGIYEEGAALSFNELLYLRQLARHPGLARTGTELSRIDNGFALSRLNSGLGSRLGLYATNGGRQLFPGSSTSTEKSWWAFTQRVYPSTVAPRQATDANALLGQYLAKTHESGAPTCSAAQYSKALLDCIDQNHNGRTSSSTLVAAARAMKLNVGN